MRTVVRLMVVVAATMALALQGAQPAVAKLKSSGIKYTGTKSVKCPKGQYGYLFEDGDHVSYKKVYHKNGKEMHWSSTVWTGFNGGDTLIRILGKTGGKRTARAYMAVAPDTRHGMSAMSKLNFYTFCDKKDLIGDNYGDATKRLTQIWRSTYWKVYR